jgi:hypothetical protein
VGGDHDDGRVRPLAELAAHLHAVDIRQLKIEQDDVGGAGERIAAGHDVVHQVATPGQAAHELRRNAVVVLDHEHAGAGLVGGDGTIKAAAGRSHGIHGRRRRQWLTCRHV